MLVQMIIYIAIACVIVKLCYKITVVEMIKLYVIILITWILLVAILI